MAAGYPWERYHELQAKREAERLTPEEHAERIDLTDQIEGWNVRRLELSQQLAARRPLAGDGRKAGVGRAGAALECGSRRATAAQ